MLPNHRTRNRLVFCPLIFQLAGAAQIKRTINHTSIIMTLFRFAQLAIVTLLACSFTGCATWVVQNPRKTITLEEATSSLGRSLVAMKQAQIEANGGRDFRTGLVPSEAEVTFKVSATGSDSKELTLDVTPDAGVLPFQGKLFGKLNGARSAERSNLVTIKFKNIVFEETNPNLATTMSAMKGGGLSYYRVPSTGTNTPANSNTPNIPGGGGLEIFQRVREVE